MEVIVGSPECSSSQVVSTLCRSPGFSLFYDNWADVARELNINLVKIKSIRKNLLIDKYTLNDAVHEIIEAWIGMRDNKSFLTDLCNALSIYDMHACSQTLQRRFGIVSRESSASSHSTELAFSNQSERLPSQVTPVYNLSPIIHRLMEQKGKNIKHYSQELAERITNQSSNNQDADIDNLGMTVLHKACLKTACVEKVELLMKNQKYRETAPAKDFAQHTFLHIFFTADRKVEPKEVGVISRLLVQHNCAQLFNVPGSINKSTPFHWALYTSEPDKYTLAFLKSNSINFNLLDEDGDISLTYAILGNKSVDCLKSLIRFGAKYDHKNKNKENFAHISAAHGTLDTLEFFATRKFISAVNNRGESALHSAAPLRQQNLVVLRKQNSHVSSQKKT